MSDETIVVIPSDFGHILRKFQKWYIAVYVLMQTRPNAAVHRLIKKYFMFLVFQRFLLS